MTKPPPIERFRVTTFVPKEGLGEVIAALTRMGLTEVNFDLVTDIKTFKTFQKTGHTIKSETFLSEWLKHHATFRASDVVKHFLADGRTSGAAYTALRVMSADGRLRKLGDGMYQRPDVRAIAGPKKKAKAAKTKTKKHSVSSNDFVLRVARRNHGRLNSLSMKKLFEADGRPSTGVGPTINKLLKLKLIKRVGVGEYVLLAKASNGAKPPAAKSALAVEVPSNG